MTEIDKDALEAELDAAIDVMATWLATIATKAGLDARPQWERLYAAINARLAASPAPVVDESEMMFAMHMARNRLEQFADEANAGRAQAGGRELKRKIWGAFQEFDALQAALPLPKEAYVDATLDEFGGDISQPRFDDQIEVPAHTSDHTTPTHAPVEAKPVKRFHLPSNGYGPQEALRIDASGELMLYADHQASIEALRADIEAHAEQSETYRQMYQIAVEHRHKGKAAEAELAKIRKLTTALADSAENMLQKLSADDDEGLLEYAEPVSQLRSAIADVLRATLEGEA